MGRIKCLASMIKKIVCRSDHRTSLLRMMPQNSVCAEIGVWRGDFSAQILKTVLPSKLHLIDPWLFDDSYPTRWYGGKEAQSQKDMDEIYECVANRFSNMANVTIHREYSDIACNHFEDKCFDWIYIDGNHSYEYVLSDLQMYLPKVKAGGFVTGDDFTWQEPNGEYSVKLAVDYVCASEIVEKVLIKNKQFVLAKKMK